VPGFAARRARLAAVAHLQPDVPPADDRAGAVALRRAAAFGALRRRSDHAGRRDWDRRSFAALRAPPAGGLAVIALRDVTLPFAARGGRGLRDSLSRLAQRERAPQPGRVTALRGVCLDVARGERVGVIGFNGAGKTTMLKVMCGIYPPTEGRVTVEGD